MIRTASGPSPATSREACANRKSPVKIAIELSQRALADLAPRRRSASSITSSWYSVARWISSTTADATITSSASGRGPTPAATSVNNGRNRLPPACMRCDAASVTKPNSLISSRSSSSSTRAKPDATLAERSGSASSMPASMVGAFTVSSLCQVCCCPVPTVRYATGELFLERPTQRQPGWSRQQRNRNGEPIEHRTGEESESQGHDDGDRDHDDRQDPGHHHERRIGGHR